MTKPPPPLPPPLPQDLAPPVPVPPPRPALGLPEDAQAACLVGRVWRDDLGPSVVTLRHGLVVDVTDPRWRTLGDLMARPDPAGDLRGARGLVLGPLSEWLDRLLAPVDLAPVLELRAAGGPMVLRAAGLAVHGAGARLAISPDRGRIVPLPLIGLVLDRTGRMQGACLGLDPQPRGRRGAAEALHPLALGPFLRLFTPDFQPDALWQARPQLRLSGPGATPWPQPEAPAGPWQAPPGLPRLPGSDSLPDGAVLCLPAPALPEPPATARWIDDVARVCHPRLGMLSVRLRSEIEPAPPGFGLADLMATLARRGLF